MERCVCLPMNFVHICSSLVFRKLLAALLGTPEYRAEVLIDVSEQVTT